MKISAKQKLFIFDLILYLAFVAAFCNHYFVDFYYIEQGDLGLFPFFKYIINPVPYFSISYSSLVFAITSAYAVIFLANISVLFIIRKSKKNKSASSLLPKFKNKVILANTIFTLIWLALCVVLWFQESGVGLIYVSVWIATAIFAIQFLVNFFIGAVIFIHGLNKRKDYSEKALIFFYSAFLVYVVTFIASVVINIMLYLGRLFKKFTEIAMG